MLVVRTSCLDQKLGTYVFLSESYVNGRAPYDRDAEEILPRDNGHWYPRWKFQQEAIEHILTTGPAVCKSESQKSVQAHIHYDFLLSGEETHRKWKTSMIPCHNLYSLSPITSSSKMKSLILQPQSKTCYTPSTSEGTCLQKQLKKELKNCQLMTNLCSQMETRLQQTHSSRTKKHHRRKQPRKKKKRRHYSSSSTQSSTTTDNSSTDSSN